MPTVLVVDDSATVRTQASRVFSAAGFDVRVAVDGVDALEQLAASGRVDLIICDVNMPRMSGVELVEELASRPAPHIPVIMLTTEARPELVQRAKANGVKAWMIKPFQKEALVTAARALTALAV